MPLRPFSDHRRGLFVTVDGPSGAGKSTTVAHLAQVLTSTGEQVHTTAEPSTGPIGKLARDLTETVTGPALACLYAADRYHQLDTEIRPHLDAGDLILCDRYVPSGLVMQRFDGVDPAFLWALNATADRPDLAVVLEADPAVIAARLADRGPHNRFQAFPGSAHAEAHFYRQACDRLIQAGYDVLRVDVGDRTPDQVAAVIIERLTTFFSSAVPAALPSQLGRRSRMSLDSPYQGGIAVDNPAPDDPLVVFQEAVNAAMRGRSGKTPHLLTSGPWRKTAGPQGTFDEVRVWRGDKGGPRVRVTTVTARGGERWYATIPPVPPYAEPEPPVRREKVGADLGPFIETLMTECAPLRGRM